VGGGDEHVRDAVPDFHRVQWRLAQLEAVVLIGDGVVLTTAGLLVQAAVIHRSAHADSRALAWHAFLWDPWFLVWGLAVALALRPHATSGVRHESSTPNADRRVSKGNGRYARGDR
jgi:succinate dehydrogenase hydrophobic anchor subunit